MTNKPNNPPAFPSIEKIPVPIPQFELGADIEHHEVVKSDGMSLRDYFAAKAMQGLLASVSDIRPGLRISETCYEVADAMLAEREK